MNGGRKLALANLWVGIGAFAVASAMALMQALSRAELDLPFRTAKMYYLSVTAHGVLMALVFTTFFIMGMGYAFTEAALGRPLVQRRFGWVSFWIALLGTLLATWAILWDKATVLYTFYPPLQAHPAFYIGATLLIVGSWGWSWVMIRTYLAWKRENPGARTPLPVHGMLATIIVWLIATVGVAAEMLLLLIPWSLGIKETVDPVLARMLFWYFGHPLVYFWVLPAYVIWYTVAPKVAGGKLFSDPLARLVFVLFIVLSTPVGFHHQFLDPGIEAGWKLLHTFNTSLILFPSLVTAFTVVASFEIAGRMRGGRGLFGWLEELPWGDPTFSSVALAMLLFAVGGFGGAINAAYSMNAMVHNTAWIQGHFHLTVGTATALTFMGAAYWLMPKLLGRELELSLLARIQPYLWFMGMLLFSFSNHLTGLKGMPRRIYEFDYGGSLVAQEWARGTYISAAGGIFLYASALCFVAVMVGTALAGRKVEPQPIEFAEPVEPPGDQARVLDKLWIWVVLAVLLVLVSYALPIFQHLQLERFGAPGFRVY
ncbi:MAG: b(o/a)3-type cytochrome-c oxidase subunit 1 [Gemmatimonadetes bacterium]|nr:b(o/a)3-type cytochrome-c oxidase subunit 1 [Gemmatimonadota bacterium]